MNLVETVPARGSAAALLLSALCLAWAPRLMPEDYSWLEHTTSESGAQGIEGAWLARLGFLLFGLAVLHLASQRSNEWSRWGTRLHFAFGVFMTAVAAFSDRPWRDGATYDAVEDALHTTASNGVGFAFAFGTLIVGIERARRRSRSDAIDLLAVAAAALLPLAMTFLPQWDGALQRLLFAVAYGWYLREAVSAPQERTGAGRGG